MNLHKKWCYRLLLRNRLTFREDTHVGQELPENYREKDRIHKIKWSLSRTKLFRVVSNSKYLVNSDIFLARTKTIAKIGSKTVNIKTYGQDKVRVTAILWIVAEGTKLLPMLIFKGEPNGRIAKELENIF